MIRLGLFSNLNFFGRRLTARGSNLSGRKGTGSEAIVCSMVEYMLRKIRGFLATECRAGNHCRSVSIVPLKLILEMGIFPASAASSIMLRARL